VAMGPVTSGLSGAARKTQRRLNSHEFRAMRVCLDRPEGRGLPGTALRPIDVAV